MRLSTLALASAFAVTGTLAFARTARRTVLPLAPPQPRQLQQLEQRCRVPAVVHATARMAHSQREMRIIPIAPLRLRPVGSAQVKRMRKTGANFTFVCRAPAFRVVYPELESRLAPKAAGPFVAP